MREELKNLKTSDPKEYWKILNRGREKKQRKFTFVIKPGFISLRFSV
jgi:hypothetical protein